MSTILLTIIGLLLLFGFVASGIAFHVAWRLTHPVRKALDMVPADFGINHTEEVSFPSREETISLSGWYFSAKQNGYASRSRTLIFAHGYSQNRLEPHLPALSLAARLLARGYDVLMFDFRNAGDSSPSLTTIGLREQKDLLGAIDFAAARRPGYAIGLIGFSMGAATSLLVGGADERVSVIVADSPFYSLREYLQENLPQWTGLPRFPFNWLILTLCPILLGANPREVKPYLAVKKAKKPIFFIHGTGDSTIPSDNSERLRALATDKKASIWFVPDAGHVRSYALVPDEYAKRVIDFLDNAME
ncbi:alpha/beta hydrolase [Brevibacillus choshinensis]|uniref:Alpha/beta hydrolase n=1 Tax=Brevibacillus choshinensis TaxID=54911 RepID=A0ABX7FPD8_BRECH|nr:alpha/beta hydrolase [Brevibacillus choshinensis]QRG66850.1 alpha/beta hydrolase [Brevibacillus choshinensis]